MIEEVNKINFVLPGILDLKSTVINTADTVRDFKIELANLQESNKSTYNLKNINTPNKVQPHIENKFKSLRQNEITDNSKSIINNTNIISIISY